MLLRLISQNGRKQQSKNAQSSSSKMKNVRFFLSSTFRPETTYGVTNLWLEPEADYVKAKINEEMAKVIRIHLIKISVVKGFIHGLFSLRLEDFEPAGWQ